jgi:hypothetical protein
MPLIIRTAEGVAVARPMTHGASLERAEMPVEEYRANAALIAHAPMMRDALALIPKDGDMVEDNPDEGARYFCCFEPYQYAQYRHASRPDPNKHARDCWYMKLREMVAPLNLENMK